jgi:hypothetical protein
MPRKECDELEDLMSVVATLNIRIQNLRLRAFHNGNAELYAEAQAMALDVYIIKERLSGVWHRIWDKL